MSHKNFYVEELVNLGVPTHLADRLVFSYPASISTVVEAVRTARAEQDAKLQNATTAFRLLEAVVDDFDNNPSLAEVEGQLHTVLEFLENT